MSDTFITIFTILIASILIFMVPVVTMAKRNDTSANQAVQVAVTEFVDTARTKGFITQEDYGVLKQQLEATGNVYDVQVSIQYIDENPAKKTSSNVLDEVKIGENVYYIKYTVQIEDAFDKNEGEKIKLSPGDYLKVDVENENQTLYQNFKRVLYSLSSGKVGTIGGTHVGIIIDAAKGEQIGDNARLGIYQIDYFAGEGSNPPEREFKTYGQNKILSTKIPTPPDEDKEFKYWIAQDGTKYRPGETYSKNENLILMAFYGERIYSVEYYSDIMVEGLPARDTGLKKGDIYTIWGGREKPTKEGYTFRGWKDQYGNNYMYIRPSDTYDINITENMKFYAIWIGRQFNIIYDYRLPGGQIGGGTIYQSLTYGTEYTIPSVYDLFPISQAQVSGYKFIGWSTIQNGEVEYKKGEKTLFEPYGNKQLYAIWAKEHTLEYNANMKVLLVYYNPDSNRTWLDESVEYLNQRDELTVDGILLTGSGGFDAVVAEKHNYDVIIVNGSAWELEAVDRTIDVNEKLKEIAESTHLITFANDEKNVPLIQSSYRLTQDASGNQVRVNITSTHKGNELIGLNLGTQSDGSLYAIDFNSDVTVLYEGIYSINAQHRRDGHVIGIGQYVKGNNWVHGQIKGVSKDLLERLIKIAINGTEKTENIVENMPENEIHAYTKIVRVSNQVPKINNATFMGWAETPNGDVVYTSGEEFTMPDEDKTLYAVWGSKIQYNSNTKVLIVEYNKSDPTVWLEPTVDYFNSTGQFIADGMSIGGGELDSVVAEKDNYDLIIINASAWSVSGISTNGALKLKNIANATNLITLGNDETRIALIEEAQQINQTEVDIFPTTIGRQLIGDSIGKQRDSTLYPIKFKDDVTVLYQGVYFDGANNEYQDAGHIIGFCEWSRNSNWIHGQVNTIKKELLYKLSKLAINGLQNVQSPIGNMPEDKVYRHGSTFNLPNNIPTRRGSTFVGWAEIEGGEAKYLPGQEFTMSRGNKTLYAVWR